MFRLLGEGDGEVPGHFVAAERVAEGAAAIINLKMRRTQRAVLAGYGLPVEERYRRWKDHSKLESEERRIYRNWGDLTLTARRLDHSVTGGDTQEANEAAERLYRKSLSDDELSRAYVDPYLPLITTVLGEARMEEILIERTAAQPENSPDIDTV